MGKVKELLCDACEPYETGYIASCPDRSKCIYQHPEMIWDNKFGMIEKGKDYMKEQNKVIDGAPQEYFQSLNSPEVRKVIVGVGKDAEIITNELGGKQSKSPMAMHLIDPEFLARFAANRSEIFEYVDEGGSTVVDPEDMEIHSCYSSIENIATYMRTGDKWHLEMAMDSLNDDELNQIIEIAKILQYGADRYEPNNWRLIPEEEHINHALVHLVSHLAGDTQDDHINHALCRLMMAYATKKSENFDYKKYIGS